MNGLQLTVAAAFAALAVLTFRQWARRRTAVSGWLAATFVALAVGLVGTRVAGLLSDGPATVVGNAARVGTVVFPYLLFRFAESFDPAPLRWRRAADVATLLVVVASVLVVAPSGDGPRPWWYLAWVAAVVGLWTALSSFVVWRLWSAGRMQSRVARRRMRTLAVAAAVLNVALVAAGVYATAGGPPQVTATIQLVGLGSAGLFYVAFAPPTVLRDAWRRSDERDLWRTQSRLLAATSREDVVATLLPHVSRLLGGGPVLFLDRHGKEIAHGAVPAALRARVGVARTPPGQLLTDEGAVVLELRCGRLGVAASPFTPVFADDELELTAWLGTLLDLALERADLFEAERRAKHEAEALTAEVESLLYGISHDLRNPIVSVLGYVDCLIEDHAEQLDDEGRHYLDRLRTNTRHMDHLIGDLLALSRVGRLDDEPQPVDLRDVVTQIAAEMGERYPRASIDVEQLPIVAMDPDRARQLFTNLLSNALQHSGRDDVTVRVSSAAGDDHLACVTVSDDGDGIPEAHRERVFKLFERLGGPAGSGRGTGIGLAMCRRIAERSGGRIWVADSEKGTDMRVELPLAQGTATEAGA